MVQDIGLAVVIEKIDVTQWVMRLFSMTAGESRGYAKYGLTTAVSRFNASWHKKECNPPHLRVALF
ncbi:MAG: hypothetical protein HQL72_13150 [Magnetococcales bacterium]|nr:hypothetical protein [Magnetococcales bacterium]